MKILIIGGTGNISWRCGQRFGQNGHYVLCLSRKSDLPSRREIKDWAEHREVDINVSACIDGKYDVVIDFVCYDPGQMRRRLELFSGKCDRYVFISTTAVYDRRFITEPISEKMGEFSTWNYAYRKFQAELILAYSGVPYTIIRPGNIYDTIFPCCSVGNPNWTIPGRIINHDTIIQHGDGTTWWSPLHSIDFASALEGVVENSDSENKIVNIAGEHRVSWNYMIGELAAALNIYPMIVDVPSQNIHRYNQYYGNSVWHHKRFNDVYDLSVLKSLVPLWRQTITLEAGIGMTIDWFMESKDRMAVDDDVNALQNKLSERYGTE